MAKSIKNFSVYFFVDGLQKASALFLVPVYTAFMEPEQYGIMSICMSISAIAPIVFFVTIYQAAYFSVLRKEENATDKIYGVFLFELLVSFIIIVCATLLNYIISADQEFLGIPWYPYAYYTLIMSALSVFPITINQVLLGSEQIKKYAVLTVFCFVTSVSLILLFMVKYDLAAMSFILGNLIVYSVVAVGVLWTVARTGRVRVLWGGVLPMLKFSAPFVPHNLAHWARGWADRLLLAWFSSPASTGVFHIAVTFGSVLNLGVEAFRNSNNPRFFSLVNQPEAQQRLVAMLSVSLCVFSFVALGLGFFAKDLLMIFTSEGYHDAYRFVPFVLSANLFSLIYINTVVSLMESGKTGAVAMVTIVSSLSSVVVGGLLVMHFNIVGAAVSMVCSNVLMAVLVYRKCQKDKRLPWPIWRASLLALLPLVSLGVDGWGFAPRLFLFAGIGMALFFFFRKDARTTGIPV